MPQGERHLTVAKDGASPFAPFNTLTEADARGRDDEKLYLEVFAPQGQVVAKPRARVRGA